MALRLELALVEGLSTISFVIKRFLAFFRKMKIVDLWELLKKWPNFVHFWFRLSPPNDFFQPRLFRCSFRSCTLWKRSLSSKNFFSQEIGHKRSYDGRNLSQKMTSFEINKEFERSKTWQKRSIDVRNIISSINVKKMHEKFNCTLGVGPYQGFSRGWVTDKGDEKYLSAVWMGAYNECCQNNQSGG